MRPNFAGSASFSSRGTKKYSTPAGCSVWSRRTSSPRTVKPCGTWSGKRCVGTGFHLELLVTHVRGDRALEDVNGLVLACVGVDGRLVAGPHEVFHDGPLAARLFADDLQLGGRAAAVGPGTTGARAGQDGFAKGHVSAFLCVGPTTIERRRPDACY